MFNCPECEKEMMWVGDNEAMEDDVYETLMTCKNCHIDVFKYWGEGVDKL